jgi:hypothetical protein
MDDDEDDDDAGAPPLGAHIKVWTDPTGREPVTEEELRLRGLPVPERRAPPPPRANGSSAPPTSATDVRTLIAVELTKKFPDFNPEWSDALKATWFQSFERIMKMANGE